MWAITNKMILRVENNTYPGGQGYFFWWWGWWWWLTLNWKFVEVEESAK